MKDEKNRAYLYTRVNDSAECGSFLDLQRRELERYCAEKGYEISGFIGFIGTAAQGKEEVDRLLERAREQHDFDVILTLKFSRLAIKYEDIVKYLNAFQKLGITVECTRESFLSQNG